MKIVWKLTVHHLRGWRINLRVSAAFLLGIGLSLYHIFKYFSFAEAIKSSVQVFEAYVLLGSRVPAYLGILLGCFLLLADAPFVTGISAYEILRTGRRKWCLSRFFYLSFACILYSAVLLLFTIGISLAAAGGYFSNNWSDAMYTLAVRQPDFVIIKYAFSFTFPEFISCCSPCEAMFLTWLFNTFYMIFSVGIVLVVNLYTNRSVGWIAALILHIAGYIAYANGGVLIPLRFSLLCCAAPAYQFREGLKMPTSYCLCIFISLNVLLFFACRQLSRRFELLSQGTEE